ncbi:MAG: MFS transporter, partial [Actinomycetia bacterium]|nr:MFS transporter [Actinomycetes bacterium]
MNLRAYREVLRIRDVRQILTLGLVLRIPFTALPMVLTLHVVRHLGRSYAEAGVAAAVLTVATGISGPWRGRMLDRVGLRATLLPSLVVMPIAWIVGAFVGFWPMVACIAMAGLFNLPIFPVARQVLIRAVADERRKTALALDSVLTEVSFMIGPLLGVAVATYADTRWVLVGFTLANVVAGMGLWRANPAITAADAAAADAAAAAAAGAADGAAGAVDAAGAAAPPSEPPHRHRLTEWVNAAVLAMLAAAVVAGAVLSASDLGLVAGLRQMGQPAMIGVASALWAFGSAAGGLVYGAMHRRIPLFALVAGLCVVTAAPALANNWFTLSVLLVVTGLFCAPTLVALTEQLSRVVPEQVRGEAMGWQGSALSAGSALGSPLAGVAIDVSGWRAGFTFPALIGIGLA